jgi:hypothetical protein
MLERTTIRLAPITSRAADLAPVAPACCNVCRTCTTTNLIGVGIAAVTAAGYAVARFAGRLRLRVERAL